MIICHLDHLRSNLHAHIAQKDHYHMGGDSELDDVRRRRIAIDERFERRLEYLKARLKGAEIHERLLKK